MNDQGTAVVIRTSSLDMQVCVPADWTDAQVKAFADRENPAGLETGWQITRTGDRHLAGDPERNPCLGQLGFVHIMLHC